MKTPYKIAFTGTHGTGKTTSVFDKAKEMKLLHSDKKVSILVENAADCPLPINKEGTERTQLWIFSNQMSREISMSAKYDILVCDRTVCDSIAYGISNGFTDLAKHQIALASRFVDTYDEIYFKTVENNNWWFNDGLRDAKDVEWRMRVQDILLNVYETLKNDYGCSFKLTVI